MTHWCRRTCWQADTVFSNGKSSLCSSVVQEASLYPCAAVWQSDGTDLLKGKKPQGHAATNPLRTGHTRCPSCSCFSSEGPTLCKSTGFILEIIFLILLRLPQQTVPQPSHPSQPVGDSSCSASLCSPVAGPWR